MLIAITSDLHYGFNRDNPRVMDDFFIDISKKNPDALLIAGDVISHTQSQWGMVLTHLRSVLPEIPIGIVLGNHDFWEAVDEWPDIPRLILRIRKTLQKYNVTYLTDAELVLSSSVVVRGFDGWYCQEPPSNDLFNMRNKVGDLPTHDWFFARARNDLALLPDKDGVYVIVVTHFDLNDEPMGGPTSFLDILEHKADLLITGHTHRADDRMFNNLRILNPGSDYNKPNVVWVEGW